MDNDEERDPEALIPAPGTRLPVSRSSSLVSRARADLRNREKAADWLRKGIRLSEDAALDPYSNAPLNPYADPQPEPSEQMNEELVAMRNGMYAEAFRCFERAHELDPADPEALCWLASCYYGGTGVAVDEARAISLFRNAAVCGHAAAMTMVGDAYAQIGFSSFPENWSKAAEWYKSAAELGDEEGLCMIAHCFEHGQGVAQDHAEAAQWLQRAAEQRSKPPETR